MKTLLFLLATTSAALAHPGIGIVKDTRGNVFYTDLAQVWKINPSGTKSVVVAGVHTHELYIDEFDNLYGEHLWYNGEAANTWGHYVWKLSPAGVFEKIIPDKEGIPKDVSFVHDHMGRSFRASGPKGCQHILKIDGDKRTMMPGDCLGNVRWMTVSQSGNLYAIDGGNILRMDVAGGVTSIANDLPKPSMLQLTVKKDHYLGGIVVDKEENVFVCDFSARNVKKISLEGNVTVVAETAFPWSPSGLLLVPENDEVWILESSVTNSVRVERIDGLGRRTVF